MAKRGRKPKSDYEKYLTAYNKARAAEMTIKSKYKGMAESAFSKAEFESMINFYDGSTMSDKIKTAVTKQRYGVSAEEYKGRVNLFKEYKIRGSLKDLRRMSTEDFLSAYGDKLGTLYHDLTESGYLSGKEARSLISEYVFGSL